MSPRKIKGGRQIPQLMLEKKSRFYNKFYSISHLLNKQQIINKFVRMSCIWCICDEDHNQKTMRPYQIKEIYKQQKKNKINLGDKSRNSISRDQKRSLRKSVASNYNDVPIFQQVICQREQYEERPSPIRVYNKVQRPLVTNQINFQPFIKRKQIPVLLPGTSVNNALNVSPSVIVSKPKQNLLNFKYYQNRQSLPNPHKLNNIYFSQSNGKANLNLANNQVRRPFYRSLSYNIEMPIQNRRQQHNIDINKQKLLEQQFHDDLKKILEQNKQSPQKIIKNVQKQQRDLNKSNFLTVDVPEKQKKFTPRPSICTSHNIDDILCTKTQSVGQQSYSSSSQSLITHCLNIRKEISQNKLTNSSTNLGQGQNKKAEIPKMSQSVVKIVRKRSLSDR